MKQEPLMNQEPLMIQNNNFNNLSQLNSNNIPNNLSKNKTNMINFLKGNTLNNTELEIQSNVIPKNNYNISNLAKIKY